MFVLHRPSESRRAEEIQETLEDLVVAHRVSFDRPADLPDGVDLPVLAEGDDRFVGEEIAERLDELETGLTFSRQISADACYVDPENPEDCL